jgi:hypothetical protein
MHANRIGMRLDFPLIRAYSHSLAILRMSRHELSKISTTLHVWDAAACRILDAAVSTAVLVRREKARNSSGRV